ncbi:tRNA (adenosine(37)-N6)-dimethylallyltransferase MiaA [Candidatus Woesebacteria bacterium RBG_13_34_9]|uniref:tRNA dimethylallyltransferase n=1 Tax=Candidatus Woesebacteria bacterium RBG_13_34_9 TaxID=1802477 RepID=A0A1F7X447_9BACT|nr:MAG: tRNA (adenosine(37)-N6)-dimethylallyltransferase MiaA [Candidatus Woesebacteria bacterium RBG_13_34_9]
MDKILVICGPTSTGKTSLAIRIAKKYRGEIISADSRQAYKGMNIGTGKDLPENSSLQFPISNLKKEKIGYYEIKGVKIWGYDLVSPDKEFSLGQYIPIARTVIGDILSRKNLPILVGGTGLYIKGVIEGIETALVPKNSNLREKYKQKSIDELQQIISSLDPFKLASMNISDRQNSRRLMRAIEILEFEIGKERNYPYKLGRLVKDVMFIGLIAPKSILDIRIDKRIRNRLKMGIEEEIRKLLKIGIKWNSQSMQALGYRQWFGYFTNEKTLKEVIDRWSRDEKKYAKRQLTWFRKVKEISWFDISKENWNKSVEKLIEKWYKSS